MKCPGFTYCMKMSLIQEIMQDLCHDPKMDMAQKIERVIYYIEFDA
jgi:hypothetical protein